MSTTLLKVKRSAVKGKTPAVGNVELGEIAINTNDGRLFFKRTDSAGNNSIKTLTEIVGGTGITNTAGTLSITNSGVTAATYGSSTQVPVFSVNAQGQIDSATYRTVAGVSGVTFDSSEATINVSTADGGSFNARIGLTSFSTSDLSEGTNLYYTTARADSDAKNAIGVSGAGLSYNASNGTITIAETTYGGFDSDFTEKSTSDLSEGTNLYHTTARARAAISAATSGTGFGGLTYNSSTGVVTYAKVTAANIRGQVSGGTGLSYNSSTGVITNDITQYTDALADSAAKNAISATTSGSGYGGLTYNASTGVVTYAKVTDANIRGRMSGGTGITYNSSTGAITTTDGDIVHDNLSGFVANEHIDHTSVSVTAGTGLTGGGTIAATRTLNVIGGKGIIANANDIQVDSGNIKGMFSGGTGVTYSDGEISIGQAVATTDDVVFNDLVVSGNLTITGSLTDIATTNLTVTDKNIVIADSATTSALTDGAGITFGAWTSGTKPLLKWDHGNTRFDFNKPLAASSFAGNITGNVTGTVSDISNHTTADLSENTNLYHTTARARGAISGTTSGTGHGGLSYNSSTGVLTYAKVTDTNIRSAISASTGIAISNGAISTSITQYTDAMADSAAKNAISATTSGTGYGGLSYAPATGVITYAKVTDANIRGRVSASGDLAYNGTTGVFSFSETYSSAAELLTALKTVDTNSSGLNADTLDGEQGSHYRINVYNSSGSLLN